MAETNIKITENIFQPSDRGTKVELDMGIFIKIGGDDAKNYGAISVAAARKAAEELSNLADQIEQRFAEKERRRQSPLGLGRGSIIRLKTGPTLVLDNANNSRPFRVVANGSFVPGGAGWPIEAPRWEARSIEETGYQVLVKIEP
jgi:hypothetical protein